MSVESSTAAELRQRIARAAEAVTDVPIDHWMRVLGPVCPAGKSWTIARYFGDPTDNTIARRLADEVRRHFPNLAIPAEPDHFRMIEDWDPCERLLFATEPG